MGYAVAEGGGNVVAAKSGTTFNEAMNPAQGLTVPEAGPQLSSAGEKPPHKLSDVIEKERPERRSPAFEKKRAARRRLKSRTCDVSEHLAAECELGDFFCGLLGSKKGETNLLQIVDTFVTQAQCTPTYSAFTLIRSPCLDRATPFPKTWSTES
jgi:hypothetical protein